MVGDLKVVVVGDLTEEVEDDIVQGTIDSPTKVFSLAIIAGYSKEDVSPRPIEFQESL
jgi:hypothetical protein